MPNNQPDTTIRVETVSTAQAGEWNDYVNNRPMATFYHRMEWKDIIEKSFRHQTYYLAAYTNGKIVGVLPMVHIKSLLFGSIMCSMPYLNFGGICADSQSVEQALLQKAESILDHAQGDYLELRHLNPSGQGLPCKTHKVSMVVDLDPEPDKLWNNFTTKHRTAVRRAAKNDLEVIRGGRELLPDFFQLLTQTWRDLGTPLYSFSFFQNIFAHLQDSVEIYLVQHRGQAVAGACNGLFRRVVEGMWAAAPLEFARLQPNYVLYWEMIRQSCARGYGQFHLGRSTADSGGAFFKEKWKAHPRQLYWEYILNKQDQIPELNVNNPRYQNAIKIWRKLPLMVTRTAGPIIAKNIP